jgi:hypothetical protein
MIDVRPELIQFTGGGIGGAGHTCEMLRAARAHRSMLVFAPASPGARSVS